MNFFVEVGSCDFDTCEQLIKNGWKGLVIEPVKVYFDKLPKYDSIIYENIAIDSNNGQSVIHYIDPQYINENNKWEKGISSLLSSGGPLNLTNNHLGYKACRKSFNYFGKKYVKKINLNVCVITLFILLLNVFLVKSYVKYKKNCVENKVKTPYY